MSELDENVQQQTEAQAQAEQVQDQGSNEPKAAEENDEASIDSLLKEFDSVLKGVDLPAYHGEEGLENLAKALLLKKRSAYKEAEQNRIEKEELEKQMSEQQQELQKLQELQAQMQQQQELLQNLHEQVKQKDAEKAGLLFNFAAEKNQVQDDAKDFIQFKLSQDLKSKQPEELKDFNIETWMTTFKESNPSLFKQTGTQQKHATPANTGGITPVSGTQAVQAGGLNQVSKTKAERSEFEGEWSAYLSQNGL